MWEDNPKIKYVSITTLEMEIQLMSYFKFKQNLIVPNASWGVVHTLHECDLLILSKNNYATEVEIKVTKADLKKDFTKSHSHEHPYIKYFYYAVPNNLKELALELIPERAGLIAVHKYEMINYIQYRIEKIRPPTPRKDAIKWTDKNRLNLSRLGAMRIYNMKKLIHKLKNK